MGERGKVAAVWRHTVGLQFELIALAGMKAMQGQTDAWLGWYKLYRQALVYRGFEGERLQAKLAEATAHQLL